MHTCTDGWTAVCDVSELEDNTPMLAHLGDELVCLVKLTDGIFAIHDTCTHGAASLSEGYVENGRIECPLHEGGFDVRCGKAVKAPCVKAVATFPVKIEGGKVMLAPQREPQ